MLHEVAPSFWANVYVTGAHGSVRGRIHRGASTQPIAAIEGHDICDSTQAEGPRQAMSPHVRQRCRDRIAPVPLFVDQVLLGEPVTSPASDASGAFMTVRCCSTVGVIVLVKPGRPAYLSLNAKSFIRWSVFS